MAAVIYFDHAAAALPHPKLAEWTAELLPAYPWNPHGTTCFAEESRRLILHAEERLLALLGTTPTETKIIWTSGITEALNLAANLTFPNEHAPSTFAPFFLGSPHPAMEEAFKEHLYPHPVLAVNHVNSETGEIIPLPNAEHPDATLVLDAAQSFGKLPLDWRKMHLDCVTLSSRKIGGPASIGALLLRKGLSLVPLFKGGGQQKGLRPGTLDAVSIELFVRVAEASCKAMEQNQRSVEALNSLFWKLLEEKLPQVLRLSPYNGSLWIAMFSLPDYEGAVLTRILAHDYGIIVAPSSACTAEQGKPPRSLRHLDEKTAMGAIRVSFAPANTEAEVHTLLDALARAIASY